MFILCESYGIILQNLNTKSFYVVLSGLLIISLYTQCDGECRILAACCFLQNLHLTLKIGISPNISVLDGADDDICRRTNIPDKTLFQKGIDHLNSV